MPTRTDYMNSQRLEAGEFYSDLMDDSFSNEYYGTIEQHLKEGGTITREVYNDLTEGQKYHFNRRWNVRGDKVQ
jgi:hypothetical protein